MSDLKQAAQQALEALEKYSGALTHFNERIDHGPAITDLKATLEQQAEPAPIYYMRDNHTFKKLSADVSTALVEIESEFNAGYTYGSLCSKREGFPKVHASGSEHRLVFFWECKTVLEKWADAPPQRKPLTDEMRKQMKEASDSIEMRGAFANGWLSAEAAHHIQEPKS